MKQDILIVGDLHVGSVFGIAPPEFETTDDKNTVTACHSERQQVLWEYWQDMCSKVSGADVVFVNGDVIDGKQQRQEMLESCIADVDMQVEAAAKVLDLLPKVKTYFIQGTEYHDLKAGKATNALARQLNGIQPTAKTHRGMGRFAWEVLDFKTLDGQGPVINIQHGVSTSVGFYRATPYDREGIFSALAGKEGKVPKADILVRSHAHIYVHVEHASKHIIGVPCWQWQTRFMRKNSAYRMLPDIGAVMLHLNTDWKDVVVEKLLYPLPSMDVES